VRRRAAKPAEPGLTPRAGLAPKPGLVLDAGALQALEKRPLRLLADLRRAHDHGLLVRIPAGALAQSWRGGARSASIARLLKQPCAVVLVDERSAKDIGEFIASVRLPDGDKPDVVDAHVALTTRVTRSIVWTSDPSDMKRYGVGADFVREL
jgi:hypothetical protein